MIKDMTGSAQSQAKVQAKEEHQRLTEEDAKRDPTAPIQRIKRQRAVEIVQAVAVDAARLALNLGILSERCLIEDDETVFLARAGRQQQELLEECLRRNDDLMQELEATKDELREQVALTAQYLDAHTRAASEARAAHANGAHWSERCRELEAQLEAPRDQLIYCPACGAQHVDMPSGEWTNPPHRSHKCAGCRHVWRHADYPTNGVAAIGTRGQLDGDPLPAGRVSHLAVLEDLANAETERESYKAALATAHSTANALRMSVADRLMMPQDSDWSQLLPLIGKR